MNHRFRGIMSDLFLPRIAEKHQRNFLGVEQYAVLYIFDNLVLIPISQTYGVHLSAFKRFADVEQEENMLVQWEHVDILAAAVGTSFEFPSFVIWPGLCVCPERLSRLLTLRSLSHHNLADVMNKLPPNVWSWRRDVDGGGQVSHFMRGSIVLNARLTLPAVMPALVSPSEARAMLPLSGSCAPSSTPD